MDSTLEILLYGLILPLLYILVFIGLKPWFKEKSFYKRLSGRAISIGFSVASTGILTLIVVFIIEKLTEYKFEGDTKIILIIVISNVMFATFYSLYDTGLDKFNKEILDEIEHKHSETGAIYRSFFHTFFARDLTNMYRNKIFDTILVNYNFNSSISEYAVTFENYLDIATAFISNGHKLIGFNYTIPPLWYSPESPEFRDAIRKYKAAVSRHKQLIKRVTVYPNEDFTRDSIRSIIEEKRITSSYDAYSWLLDILKVFPHIIDASKGQFERILIEEIDELQGDIEYSKINEISPESDPYLKILDADESEINKKLNWFLRYKSAELNNAVNEEFLRETGTENSYYCLKKDYELKFHGKLYKELILVLDSANNPCIGIGVKNELKYALILKIIDNHELLELYNNSVSQMIESNLLKSKILV